MSSVWARIEPLLARVQKPARYIGCEDGAIAPQQLESRTRAGAVSWLLAYPDTYEIGLPNQGLQILYEILNERDDAVAERAYAPWTDLEPLLRAHGVPLFSVDTHRAAGDFDLELDATAAPEAVNVFLAVALDGGYHSGRLRLVDGAIRGTASPAWVERGEAERLKLGAVPASTARPVADGIALVRGGAVGEFVVYAGAPPETVGDVVPLGRVVRGAEVLRAITGEGVDVRRVIRTE